ncbi:unnamed protein product [Paramecium octaurelia]|uniref:Uncharacterized protein n=1 Tax=Paramecium octaurelia TaxID=43137 RepID=A0A8S1TT50_PAROT|nr:unnamed protein product [Paramecium octaurelia]
MEIPFAVTFLGVFGWNVYYLVQKYKARRRQNYLIKLIDDESNSLIKTLSPYKKRKLNDVKEAVIKSPQKVDVQENPEECESNQNERIQTALEQVEQERFQKQDYIDDACTFHQLDYAQNKECFKKNKQNQDFSFASQQYNNYHDDQKIDLPDTNRIDEMSGSEQIDKEKNSLTFSIDTDQQHQKQEDDFNCNQLIEKYQCNFSDDQNFGQQIFQQEINNIGQESFHNFEIQSNLLQNVYNHNQEEQVSAFFPYNNDLIISNQTPNLVQNLSQFNYQAQQIDILNQPGQQLYLNQINYQNFDNIYPSNHQPLYSVNNFQQVNQTYNQGYQGIPYNQYNLDILSQQQVNYSQKNQSITNKNTSIETYDFKEPSQQIPKLQKDEEQFSFQQRNTRFTQINLEQNQLQKESQRTSIIQVAGQKQTKGQPELPRNQTDNQSQSQQDEKKNQVNDFSFYLQLLGGGGGGFNSKISVPSGNLLSILLNN